jgi:sulfur carrier protein
MINLIVNGKTREVEDSANLATYLASLGLNLQNLAVGYNGEVLKKERFSEVVLRDGDALEIVRPVGGG